MNRINLAVLGSTGSVGRQALDVVRQFPGQFGVSALAAGKNWPLLLEQIMEFRPSLVAVAGEDEARELRLHLPMEFSPEICVGPHGLDVAAAIPDARVVLNALSGTVGLLPTLAALRAGKNIALANKETLVAAGFIVTDLARRNNCSLLPVDSEHSALWQCLRGAGTNEVAKIILTASGGPFRREPADLTTVNVEMALAHPNWAMGNKITIDSASLMNKGLEVIEARWLFGLDYDTIDVVVHPQSIVHSMVEFVDGSVIAQLGAPDMRLPIQYALSYPVRLSSNFTRLDWCSMKDLTFEKPNLDRFPSLGLAYQAGRTGGTMPAVLNAANEVAVDAFLHKYIGFVRIPEIVERVMSSHVVLAGTVIEEIIEADGWARRRAAEEIFNKG